MNPSTLDRVLHRVNKIDRGHSTECWIFAGAKWPKSYGQIKSSEGRTVPVHRVTYEHFIGPIPDGFEVDHLCRVRACCNPDHLEAVTPAENRRRGVRDAKADRDAKWSARDFTEKGSSGSLSDCKLTTTDVSKLMGVAPSTIIRWSEQGRLRHITLPGGARRYNQNDIDNFIISLNNQK